MMVERNFNAKFGQLTLPFSAILGGGEIVKDVSNKKKMERVGDAHINSPVESNFKTGSRLS